MSRISKCQKVPVLAYNERESFLFRVLFHPTVSAPRERVSIVGAKGSSVGVRGALMEPTPFPVMVLCSAEKSNEKISFLL